MTAKDLYACTECGEPCDPYTQEIHRHATGMQHVTCPGPSIAEQVAQQFFEARKRLAHGFGQVIAIPDWGALPEGLRALSVAAMVEALNDWHIRRR